MQKWAFSTVGPITKVYASSSSLVDNNKIHWREERRTSKKDRERAKERKVLEFLRFLQMASMASTTPSTHYFFKNHKKPCKVSIPSRTIIVSQSHEEQPHKPSTDQVGRRYTLSLVYFSLTHTNTNIDKRIKFLIWSNFAFTFWREIVLRSSELAVVGAIFNLGYISSSLRI